MEIYPFFPSPGYRLQLKGNSANIVSQKVIVKALESYEQAQESFDALGKWGAFNFV